MPKAQNSTWKIASASVALIGMMITCGTLLFAAGSKVKEVDQKANSNKVEIERVFTQGCKPSEAVEVRQASMAVEIEDLQGTDDSLEIEIHNLEGVAHDTETVLTTLKVESKQMKEDLTEVKGDIKEILKAVKGK